MSMRHLVLPSAVMLLAACATTTTGFTDRDVRVADDTPVSFVTEDETPAGENSCRSPLVDPRDQTRLRLMRSGAIGGEQRGDYEVPLGRYGVREGELLRIACATGQTIGIVRSR